MEAAVSSTTSENPEPTTTVSSGFTQEQLDAAVAAAVSKFSDYDQLKADLAESKRAQETEVERQVREARETAEAGIPAQVQAATSAAREALITAELRSYAVAQGFKYPEDVIDHLRTHKDLVVTDDFKVKGAEKLVKDLAGARPEWLTPTGSFAPGRPATSPGEGGRDLTPEEEALRKQQMRQRIGVSGRTF